MVLISFALVLNQAPVYTARLRIWS